MKPGVLTIVLKSCFFAEAGIFRVLHVSNFAHITAMDLRHEISFLDIVEAAKRIEPFIKHTPLDPSPSFTARSGAKEVLLKCENLQTTGSFKLRGAVNAVLRLSSTKAPSGLIACSAGNHGAGYKLKVALNLLI